MAKHKKFGLLDAVVNAVNQCGWNVIYLSDINYHPFLLRLYNGEQSQTIRLYIWNLSHGGGAKRPANEYRIQITGTRQFEQNDHVKTLILGWWAEVGVFAGFDVRKHAGQLGFSPSIQIREENLRRAALYDFSPCDRGNKEIAIAFQPDFFVDYVLNLNDLHSIGQSANEVSLVDKVAAGEIQLNDQSLNQLAQKRKVILQTTLKRLRDNRFKQRVLTAYGNRCAVSGIQLKLVDAAHIVPVSEDTSTDETCNGIALSALHHRAYDAGLITFNEKYQVITNQPKLLALKKIGFDGGLDGFLKNLRPILHLPPAVSDRPNVDYVISANKLRGW